MISPNKGIPLGLRGRRVELFPCPQCGKTIEVGQLGFLNHGGSTSYYCSLCNIEYLVRNNIVVKVYDIRENGEVRRRVV